MQKQLQLLKAFLVSLVLVLGVHPANASHFMGGDITFVCLGNNTYAVTMKIYRDCNGITFPNTIPLNINSANCNYNSTVTVSAVTPGGGTLIQPITALCDPQNDDACINSGGTFGVEQYLYRGIVTLPACFNGSDYVIRYTDCCRNGVITTGPDNDSWYIYAILNNTLANCNSSPAFNYEPTLFFCVGQPNYFNNGVTDIDGDRLQFSLTNCKSTSMTASVTYNPPFSGTNPLTTSNLTIDPQTGQISLTPTIVQIGVICMLVEEFRNGIKIGETIRDIQVAVVDCNVNTMPVLSGINGTADSTGVTGTYQMEACVGEDVCFQLRSFDKQASPINGFQNITMEWGIGIGGASFVIDDTSYAYPRATFCWTPEPDDVGTRFFTVQVQDDACPFLGISVFTYKITVVPNNLSITASQDTTIEKGDTAQITTNSPNTNLVYSWFPTNGLSCTDCPNPLANPDTTTTYTVTIQDTTIVQNCSGTAQVTINVFTIPVSTNPIDKFVQNVRVFPNPMTTDATLSYHLNKTSKVTVEIYNIVGQRVATILNERQSSGDYFLPIGDAINQQKGIYFVRLVVNGETITKKILVQ